FFFSSRRRHTRWPRDWSSDVCSSDLEQFGEIAAGLARILFPLVLILGLTGIVVGILNSYDHFTVPALSPVLWNLIILLGLALGRSEERRVGKECGSGAAAEH